MRKRYSRRLLAALGHKPFTPTEDQKEIVKLLTFNGTPEPRIAAGLGLTLLELRYWFADQLGYAQDRLLAYTAARVIELSKQDRDPGVALRASELMLRSRLPAWREPKAQEAPKPETERLSHLSTEELERIVALALPGEDSVH